MKLLAPRSEQSRDILYVADSQIGHKLNKSVKVRIERAISSETVTTNSSGWRIRNKDVENSDKPPRYTFAGCSWAMGTGNEYEQSIVGHFERISGTRCNNLCFGSFSLLQTIMYLERFMPDLQDTTIVLLHGSWLTDRSLKDRSFPHMFRPILAIDRNGTDVRVNPPSNAPDFVVRSFTKLIRTPSLPRFLKTILSKPLLFWCALSHGYLSRGVRRLLSINDWQRLDIRNDRKRVLDENLIRLEALLQSWPKVRLHIFQMDEYFVPERKREPIQNEEAQILEQWSCSHSQVAFTRADSLAADIEAELGTSDRTRNGGLSKIHWTDNNHPNSRGSEIIASHIAKHI